MRTTASLLSEPGREILAGPVADHLPDALETELDRLLALADAELT